MKCATCNCEATTSRAGQPACWWCADPGLEGSICATCETSTMPIVADPIEELMDAADREAAHDVTQSTRQPSILVDNK